MTLSTSNNQSINPLIYQSQLISTICVTFRARRKGEHVLHSKQVLFCIIILNVIDCILVLGELILDMYYVKGIV